MRNFAQRQAVSAYLHAHLIHRFLDGNRIDLAEQRTNQLQILQLNLPRLGDIADANALVSV